MVHTALSFKELEWEAMGQPGGTALCLLSSGGAPLRQ